MGLKDQRDILAGYKTGELLGDMPEPTVVPKASPAAPPELSPALHSLLQRRKACQDLKAQEEAAAGEKELKLLKALVKCTEERMQEMATRMDGMLQRTEHYEMLLADLHAHEEEHQVLSGPLRERLKSAGETRFLRSIVEELTGTGQKKPDPNGFSVGPNIDYSTLSIDASERIRVAIASTTPHDVVARYADVTRLDNSILVRVGLRSLSLDMSNPFSRVDYNKVTRAIVQSFPEPLQSLVHISYEQ